MQQQLHLLYLYLYPSIPCWYRFNLQFSLQVPPLWLLWINLLSTSHSQHRRVSSPLFRKTIFACVHFPANISSSARMFAGFTISVAACILNIYPRPYNSTVTKKMKDLQCITRYSINVGRDVPTYICTLRVNN